MKFEFIQVSERDGWLQATLARPDVCNAMNIGMVEELTTLFAHVANRAGEIRAVVLRGAEGHFSAGGDVKDMREILKPSGEEEDPAYAFNRAFGELLNAAECCPAVLICLVEGSAFGGGFGLVCVSDLAIATTSAVFGMPETTLGIIPAQIAPFVVARIGLTRAREIALFGRRFHGERALELGVVHELVDNSVALEAALQRALAALRCCAPEANAATKRLMLKVGDPVSEELLDEAALTFAACLRSEEGREGTIAFMEKRQPKWAVS